MIFVDTVGQRRHYSEGRGPHQSTLTQQLKLIEYNKLYIGLRIVRIKTLNKFNASLELVFVFVLSNERWSCLFLTEIQNIWVGHLKSGGLCTAGWTAL